MLVRFILIVNTLLVFGQSSLWSEVPPEISGFDEDDRTILEFSFENDLITFSNTDRYFTNGIRISLQAPWLDRSLLRKLMIPYGRKAYVAYNLSVVQDMYTPSVTQIPPTLKNDRPYSSYLYIGFQRTLADPVRRLIIVSQLNTGYIGPYSPGSYLQTFIHKIFPKNEAPLGWKTQIDSDVILNYNVQVNKAIINHGMLTVLANLDARIGTLYNDAGTGIVFQAGMADPVFGLANDQSWRKYELYLFGETNARVVGYNALLQGGLFNPNNVYTLRSDQIQRLVVNTEVGLHIRYEGMTIEVAQHFISPEFKWGLRHKWGRISLFFQL